MLQKKAPRNSVAPLKIEMEQLFKLDVNDDIWVDVGIGYNDEEAETVPPLWLSDENVRAGIRALTDRDRCLEEQERLHKERSAIQLWFSEEWRVVNSAIEQSKCILFSWNVDVEFPFSFRHTYQISAYLKEKQTLSSIGGMGADSGRCSMCGRVARLGSDTG